MTNLPVTELPAAPLFLFEELPRVTSAALRPFVYAICLARGAVTAHEVVTAAHSFFSPGDNEPFTEDEAPASTCLELCVESLLNAMVNHGELRYNTEKSIYEYPHKPERSG